LARHPKSLPPYTARTSPRERENLGPPSNYSNLSSIYVPKVGRYSKSLWPRPPSTFPLPNFPCRFPQDSFVQFICGRLSGNLAPELPGVWISNFPSRRPGGIVLSSSSHTVVFYFFDVGCTDWPSPMRPSTTWILQQQILCAYCCRTI
jgi:hypothetical protein